MSMHNKNKVSGKKSLTKKIKSSGKAILGLCGNLGYTNYGEQAPEMVIGGQYG